MSARCNRSKMTSMRRSRIWPQRMFDISTRRRNWRGPGRSSAIANDNRKRMRKWALLLSLILVPPGIAEDQDWNIHFQATSIGDMHGSFRSPYEGLNSLPPHPERRVSLTATLFFAARLSNNTIIVINPELAGGKGFGGVTGIAGFPNGEIPRVAAATPKPYLARGFIQNTWALGDDVEMAEDDANQLRGALPLRRLRSTAGRFALSDFFDNNSYSHDPRTQFMNWALMYNGAWDYPADSRGYTVGLVEDLAMRNWSLRVATALEPTVANGPDLDWHFTKNRGLVTEWERRYSPLARRGALRILGYLNRDRGGVFREAVQLAHGGVPDLAPTRRNGSKKYGFGINLEQAINQDIGLFARYGWSDGKTESWAFTQIDRSLSGGTSIGGRRWNRPLDRVGIAGVRNYL